MAEPEHSLPLATVKPEITTVEQLDTEAAAAADATVHVALFATSVGEATKANAECAARVARRSDARSIIENSAV